MARFSSFPSKSARKNTHFGIRTSKNDENPDFRRNSSEKRRNSSEKRRNSSEKTKEFYSKSRFLAKNRQKLGLFEELRHFRRFHELRDEISLLNPSRSSKKDKIDVWWCIMMYELVDVAARRPGPAGDPGPRTDIAVLWGNSFTQAARQELESGTSALRVHGARGVPDTVHVYMSM